MRIELRAEVRSLEFGYMAWQCPERRGYHINVESLFMEFPAEPQDGTRGRRSPALEAS